ncbi:phage tail protein [Paenibacillus sp. MBLB2552]|uniref:Phage tail protein n=1 Tax=Paenibacillus mellifer TaxID=2937794 RepID=A0A9X2BTI9_9BACL|nr:phage tail protein [Paenibacillus mellifer]MCK8488001.1 phage tail protein [Paenibacillus mellifer]
MATNTPNLNLLKKDPVTDGNETFNIQTMLNDNWDKIDAAVGEMDIPDASLTVKGKVQLSNAIDGTREDVAATSRAVKAVCDNFAAQLAGLTQDVQEAKQAGNERKSEVVAALVAKGISASTLESWDSLISKLAAIVKATGNATGADLLAGKTASNASGLITGTIPIQNPDKQDQILASSAVVGASTTGDATEYVYLGIPNGKYLNNVNWVRHPKCALANSFIPNLANVGLKTIEPPSAYENIWGRDVNRGIALFAQNNTQASIIRFRSKGIADIITNYGSNQGMAISNLRYMFYAENIDASIYWRCINGVVERFQLVPSGSDFVSQVLFNFVLPSGKIADHQTSQMYQNEFIIACRDSAWNMTIHRYDLSGNIQGVSAAISINAGYVVFALPEGKTLLKYVNTSAGIMRYMVLDRFGNILENFNPEVAKGIDYAAWYYTGWALHFKTYDGNYKFLYNLSSNYYPRGGYDQTLVK